MTAEDWKRRSVCGELRGGELEYTEETDLEVLSSLTDKALEGQLADEELGRLLVASNFTERDSTRPEPVGFLHATSSSLEEMSNTGRQKNNGDTYGCLAGSGRLGSELFTRGFTTGRLASLTRK